MSKRRALDRRINMSTSNQSKNTTTATTWAGRILSGLTILMLTLDSVMKILQLAPAVEGTAKLGFPPDSLLTLGLLELGCVLLYAYRRTAMIGAVLLTGYLGGAIATHFRLGDPMMTHVLFPTYVATFAWGGLYLRDARLRGLVSAA